MNKGVLSGGSWNAFIDRDAPRDLPLSSRNIAGAGRVLVVGLDCVFCLYLHPPRVMNRNENLTFCRVINLWKWECFPGKY